MKHRKSPMYPNVLINLNENELGSKLSSITDYFSEKLAAGQEWAVRRFMEENDLNINEVETVRLHMNEYGYYFRDLKHSWQPMNTCPKDIEVLLYTDIGHAIDIFDSSTNKFLGLLFDVEAFAWMPLPDPPNLMMENI